jgi:hypothetical protein
MEKTMFDFTKTTKQYEEFADRMKQAHEFWLNLFTSSLEDFYKPKKK